MKSNSVQSHLILSANRRSIGTPPSQDLIFACLSLVVLLLFAVADASLRI
jgi:hypothetical protein